MSKLAATIPRGLEFRGRNHAVPERANGNEEIHEAQQLPQYAGRHAQVKGGQLALDLPPGEARRPERREPPRLDLIQFGLRIRTMRGEKVRYAARYKVWISDHGRAWWPRSAKPWDFLEAQMRKDAHGYVTAHWPTFKKRRSSLMAEAWLEPRPSGLQVRHKDGDKLNDAAWNLEYGTALENTADAIRHGTKPPRKLSRAACIGALLTMRTGETDATCAKRLGVTTPAIYQLRTGRAWQHIAPCLPRRAEWKAMQQ